MAELWWAYPGALAAPPAHDRRNGYKGPMGVFTAPWPGPGNSEGPPDPEGWSVVPLPVDQAPELQEEVEETLAVTAWPGPGDSDG